MSLESLCSEDVVVMRFSDPATFTTDAEGVSSKNAAPAEKTYGGMIQQTDAHEVQVGPDTQVSDHLLIMVIDPTLDPATLPRAQLHPQDRVRRGTDVFDVVGEPDAVKTPRGPHHIEANLRLTENP